MAKSARFKVGSSGSGKHTEMIGDGSNMGGRPPAESGPRIGPGVMGKRMTPDYDRNGSSNGDGKVKGMKRYEEG